MNMPLNKIVGISALFFLLSGILLIKVDISARFILVGIVLVLTCLVLSDDFKKGEPD